MRRDLFKLEDIIPLQRMVYYTDHPVEFIEDYVFHKDSLANGGELYVADDQKEMLTLLKDNRRVAIKSGHGCGKSSGLVFAILWWMCVHSFPRVVATAPSKPQLQSVLWPEMAKWLNISLLKPYFELTATRLYLKEDMTNSFSEIRTASKEESLQGIHERNLLLIMDEAPGIDDSIHIMLQGALTRKNNKIIQVGNPTRTSGYFHDAFHKFKHRWKHATFNSEESSLVDKDYIEDMRDKWGVHHNIYRVRVLGEFPLGDPDAFISLEEVEAAVVRWDEMEEVGIPEIGVDVARKGDDLTVICIRIGYKVLPLITKEKTHSTDITAMVLQAVDQIRIKTGYDGVIKVKVDDTGVGGGVTDELVVDRDHNIEVIPCNFGGAGDDQYSSEASKMWGTVKNYIHLVGLPDDRHLTEELAARRWDTSDRGRITIEPKRRFKKDFGNSPDRADALVLCFADKKNPRKVLKHFDPVGEEILEVADTYRGDQYCSLYYSKDVLISAVWAYWNGTFMRITDEFVGSDTDVIDTILCNAPYKRVIGNKHMFNMKGEDLFHQYSKYGIFLLENYNYDEFGAIRHLDVMTKSRLVKINGSCKETIKQLDHWSMVKTTQHDLANEYGLCYAILQIVSELKKLPSPEIMRDAPTYIDRSAVYSTKNPNSGFESI